MKKTLLMICLLLNSSTQAGVMTGGYDQLVKALEQGDDIKALVHMEKCQLKNAPPNQPKMAYPAETMFNFSVFSHYVLNETPARYTVATSNSMMLEHEQFGMVRAYGRLRIFEDNQAELHTAYYDPRTYEKKLGMDFVCSLSKGHDNNAVVLIDKNA